MAQKRVKMVIFVQNSVKLGNVCKNFPKKDFLLAFLNWRSPSLARKRCFDAFNCCKQEQWPQKAPSFHCKFPPVRWQCKFPLALSGPGLATRSRPRWPPQPLSVATLLQPAGPASWGRTAPQAAPSCAPRAPTPEYLSRTVA